MGGGSLISAYTGLMASRRERQAAQGSMDIGKTWLTGASRGFDAAERVAQQFSPYEAAATAARMSGYGFNRMEADSRAGSNSGYLRNLAQRGFNRQAQQAIYDTGTQGTMLKANMLTGIASGRAGIGNSLYGMGMNMMGQSAQTLRGVGDTIGGAMAGIGGNMFGNWANNKWGRGGLGAAFSMMQNAGMSTMTPYREQFQLPPSDDDYGNPLPIG